MTAETCSHCPQCHRPLAAEAKIGRTTRMLQHAIELEAQGRAVYVVAATGAHAVALRSALVALGGKSKEGLRSLDMHNMRLRARTRTVCGSGGPLRAGARVWSHLGDVVSI
jgi:hypothetical protein